MVVKKTRIVIIGAGMAGLTAANRLYTSPGAPELFDIRIIEAGDRIGGRIRSSHFAGDRIELGATYIHGIGGSPVHKIACDIGALHSDQPWERMDGFPDHPVTIAEGGLNVDSSIVHPISILYQKLMSYAQDCTGSAADDDSAAEEGNADHEITTRAVKLCSRNGHRVESIGSFLRQGLEMYWTLKGQSKLAFESRRSIEEAVFAIYENTERTYTSAGDLYKLDFEAESEYRGFPGEEITIAKGYSSIIHSLASVLPLGVIQLGKKVEKIEWHPYGRKDASSDDAPVTLHLSNGSAMEADHVIITISLGVLKATISGGSSLFSPLLPSFKTDAISRLGFGVVNKLFLHLDQEDEQQQEPQSFPFLQLAFQQNLSLAKQGKIPWWMRKTASVCPIFKNSRVLLSWFAGDEALELESLKESEIIAGVSSTISSFDAAEQQAHSHCRNGGVNGAESHKKHGKFTKALRSSWGTDPLFLGSYSYVAVGSSGEDFDLMAEPLPKVPLGGGTPPLQLLFAGEATHRTHYSTTHGAYFSGIREANRLLQHYNCELLQ